jgi:hypothetical protein
MSSEGVLVSISTAECFKVWNERLIWSMGDSVLRRSVKKSGCAKGRDKGSVHVMVRIGNSQGLRTW